MLETLLLITALFVIGLGVKSAFGRGCAICLAVSGAWLAGFFLGFDPLILSMLMGGSAVGLMYYLELKFLKLPYLLSVFALIYSVFRGVELEVWLVVLGVWIAFGVLYTLRGGKGSAWFKKVVECCRNW